MASGLATIAIEDFFAVFQVNVDDNGTDVGRAECLDEYLSIEGRICVDRLNGMLKILE